MQKITVKSIKHDEGENKPFIITTADGAKMSGFDTGLGNLKPGAVIEVEVKVDGKFINIKKWQPVSEPVANSNTPIYVGSALEIVCLQELGHYIREGDMLGANAPYRVIVDKYWEIIDRNLDILLDETKAPAVETKPAAGEIPAFKAGHELFNYALKHGYTIDKIKEVLGIKNPTEITDIKIATEKLFPKEK
jgi:hypothetical protein